MPAMGATRKELENSVNPGQTRLGKGLQRRCSRASNEGVDYLSNGPQGLKWLLKTRVSGRSLGIRGSLRVQ